jgi:hypothetical protein
MKSATICALKGHEGIAQALAATFGPTLAVKNGDVKTQ